MARLIFKAPYYQPRSKVPSGSARGGYANYIATREGVEILPRGGMVVYIGERRGSNGLFSDDGDPVILSQITKEMDEHEGNIWGLIFSLTREDAERLGYNQASQWVSLLRSHRNDIAREMHIAPKKLRWYAAYHNAEGHPHVHVLVWSTNPHEPYLSTVGIHNIKQTFAADIFRQDNISNYKKQTQARDELKAQFRIRIAEINKEIQSGAFSVSADLVYKLEELSAALDNHKGKKVYGYLSKKNKDLVDEIVKMVAQDEKISELYGLWYQLQCENYRNYTDQMPKKIPLETNKEFKSLRNFVVKSASEMLTDIPEPNEFDDDYIWYRKYGDNETVLKQVRYVKGELKIEPPKTKASERSIILSPPILEMLTEYGKTIDSIWLFPSPVKEEDVPRDPSACRKALARILKRAECEHVPFHAMRHTFASNAFHYGMDVKTLASTIGHESVETTLNVYAHSSEQMKRDAAKKIDETIGTVLGADVTASDALCGDETSEGQDHINDADKPKTVEFKPYQPKYRKRGTGSVHQVSKNVWEGRYTPTVNGKRIARNIYADSEEECEIKLEALIREMKTEFGIK